MGYELTFSRGNRWADDGSFSEISIEEWNATIAALPSLNAVEEVRGQNPLTGEEIVVKNPNGAQLELPEELKEDGYETGPALSWRDGVIKAPHAEELLQSYKAIAETLNCQIYGEEGEPF